MRPDIQTLLTPRSFALIGASDKSTFSSLLHRNLVAAGLEPVTHLVNPRSPQVHGRATVPSCQAIGSPIDLAFVMVGADHVPGALRDAAAAGARAALILSSGYAEAGAEGRRRQQEIVDVASDLGITVLGPNVLGFVNAVDGIPAIALSDPPRTPGSVALISQSGASCGAMRDYAELAGVDLSHVITVGNEAMVTIADLVDHLVDDDRVKAIAIFMEAIRKPELFAAAARRAAAKAKPIVVLKAGRSDLAARAAASHTGALVGDDRVVDAVFRQCGIIRVDTVEDMLTTAGLGARTGPITGGGLGVVSISGGACDIVADLAEAAGVDLPQFTAETTQRLAARLPAFGHAHNPLDITGAAITDPPLWSDAIAAVATDPGIGAVLAINSLPWREDGAVFYGRKYVEEIGRGLSAAAGLGKAGVYVTQVSQPLGPQVRELLRETGVPQVVTGLRAAVDAFGRLAEWTAVLSHVSAERPVPGERLTLEAHGTLSEADSRAVLESFGVPFVPSVVATSAAEATTAAAGMDGPLAFKIVSPDIAHKSDIGGVRLNVAADAAASTYDDLIATCAAAVPEARLDGVLISPMRASATELLVGVTRNPDWGLILAVGIGGVLVEVLDDVVLAPLPLAPGQARRLLDRLRGAALLRGVRGRPPADLDRLAAVVESVAAAAVALGERLETLEINPVRVDADQIEALDALVVLTSGQVVPNEPL